MEVRKKLVELHRAAIAKYYWVDHPHEAIADELIAHGVTIQKWIPVSERLPEADKNVLVCTIHGSFKVAGCNFYKNGTEVSWATNDGLGERVITHWMPLPEPPKEE